MGLKIDQIRPFFGQILYRMRTKSRWKKEANYSCLCSDVFFFRNWRNLLFREQVFKILAQLGWSSFFNASVFAIVLNLSISSISLNLFSVYLHCSCKIQISTITFPCSTLFSTFYVCYGILFKQPNSSIRLNLINFLFSSDGCYLQNGIQKGTRFWT